MIKAPSTPQCLFFKLFHLSRRKAKSFTQTSVETLLNGLQTFLSFKQNFSRFRFFFGHCFLSLEVETNKKTVDVLKYVRRVGGSKVFQVTNDFSHLVFAK